MDIKRLTLEQKLIALFAIGAIAVLAIASFVRAQTPYLPLGPSTATSTADQQATGTQATSTGTSANQGTTTGQMFATSTNQNVRPTNINTSMTGTVVVNQSLPPMVVNIGNDGSALLRGVVVSVGPATIATTTTVAPDANSIKVATWGGTWTVLTQAGTQFLPAGITNTDLSGIRVGDFVGLTGIVVPGESLTVTATLVRNWTTTAAGTIGTGSTGSGINVGTGLPPGIGLYTGTIGSITGNAFTLTDALSNVYTVVVGPDTIVWDNERTPMSFNDIQAGDSMRVNGTISGTTVTATVIRDTSR